MTRCKFFPSCRYASKDDATCAEDGGGNYCGEYRERMKQKKQEATAQ
jgi:hypothetical protein